MKLEKLSASKISTYKTCEFKFYLEYHLGIPGKPSFATEQGTLVHEVFERHALELLGDKDNKNFHKKWQDLVLNTYRDDEIWRLSMKANERQKDCPNCPFFRKRGQVCNITNQAIDQFAGCPRDEFDDTLYLVRQIVDNAGPDNPLTKKILETENKFTLEIPDGDDTVKVSGIIDLVTENDPKTVEVTDYKSGKYIKSYDECTKDPQLLIYNLAVQDKYDQYENFFITIYYLRRNPMTFSFSGNAIEATKQALVKYWNVIKTNISPKRRCDFGTKLGQYDRICKNLCNPELCEKAYDQFRNNGYRIMDSFEV